MKYYNINIKKYQIGYSSEYANNLFDFSEACKVCKTGARVIAPHKLKEISASFDKHLFSTNNRDCFISEKLFGYLKNMEVVVSDLNPTINQKGKIMPFYQLTSYRTCSQAKSTRGFRQYHNHCEVCRRDNFSLIAVPGNPVTSEDVEFVYKKSILNFLNDRDIFNTWECLRRSLLNEEGMPRVLPKPMLIVSQKFKDALASFGIDYVDYWEVKFE